MRQLSSKHAFHEKEHSQFISLVTLTLLLFGLLSLLCPLVFCHLPDGGNAPLIYHASAKEREGEGSQISEAVFLSRSSIHQISLSPYSQRYYYLVFQENDILKILSCNTSIQVTFYSQNGNQMHFPKKNQQYHFDKASVDNLSAGDRIFVRFASTSTKPCTIKVQYKKSPAKNAKKKITVTHKPGKTIPDSRKAKKQKRARPASKKANAQMRNNDIRATRKPMPRTFTASRNMIHTTPKPSPAAKKKIPATPKPSPTAKKKLPKPILHVNPHFLRLAVGTKKELSLSLGKSSLYLSDCAYFLTDSSLASVQGNAIFGKKEGITILYFRTKKSAICGSCLIRIT